eukprot:m51a1_g12130 hypothetical protein (325) ;mRNA; r:884-2117
MSARCGLNAGTLSSDYKEVSLSDIETSVFNYGGSSEFENSDEGIQQWQRSVTDKPVPISVTLDSYAFLVDDESQRSRLQDMIAAYIVASQIADSTLEIGWTYTYEPSYNDGGSGATMDLTAAHPRLATSGFVKFGDSTAGGSHNLFVPGRGWDVFVRENQPSASDFGFLPGSENPLVRFPIGFTQAWIDRGSGARLDGAFWNPVCPYRYNAVGSVVTIGYNPPPYTEAACVQARCTAVCSAAMLVYNDRSSGASLDGSLYVAAQNDVAYASRAVYALSGYNWPNPGAFYCLRNSCLTNPMKVTPELVSRARRCAETRPQPVDVC